MSDFWYSIEEDLEETRKCLKETEQELERKDNEIKQLQEDIKNHIKIASEYKEQMIIKDNIINELKYGIQKIRDLLYEKFRIQDEDGYYSMNNTDLQDFYDILDKIKELEENK